MKKKMIMDLFHRKMLIASAIVLTICLIGAGVFAYSRYKKPVEAPYVAPKPPCVLTTEGLLSEINSYRDTPLVLDQSLTDYATHRLAEVKIDFSHTGFKEDNRQYFNVSIGEDLAKRYCPDSKVVTEWMKSSTHRAIIEDSRYDHVGFAFDSIYAVAIFGDFN